MGVNRIRPFRRETKITFKDFYSIKESTNIPRLLLRRFFIINANEKWEKKLQYVFCPFKHTLKNINCIGITNDKKFKTILEKSNIFYGFPENVLKILIHSYENQQPKEQTFHLLHSIIFRLYHCHKLMEKYRQQQQQKIVFWIQLFIDIHLDLCIYMNKYNIYNDEELLEIDKNRNDLIKSVLDQYEPHDWRVSHGGNLPDLTPCIDMGNIWYDVRPKPRIENITCALIHIIACKTQSHKCQLRNFMRILQGYFQKYPEMIEIFRMLIEISMLGNYLHAEYRPCFEIRLEIRKSFQERNILNNNYFFLWMMENEQLVYYATKEMYVFMVESQYILDVIMKETSYWDEIKKSIIKAMDMSRTAICTLNCFSWEKQYSFTEILDKDLKQIHQHDMLPHISKLKKAIYLDMMVQEMTKYHEKNIINKNSTAIQSSEMLLSAYFINDDDDIDGTEEYMQILSDMQFVIDSRCTDKETNQIELKWLKCFKISERGYEEIRLLLFDYECKDIADNAINRRLDRIYKNSKYDFHMIHVFFKLIQEKKSFGNFKLSYDYAKNQIFALRSKYSILPWDFLPENADLFHYCSVCKRWLNPIIDPVKNRKSKLNIYAQGFEKALYDYDNDNLYCGKQNNSINVRKLMDSGIYYEENDIDNPTYARIIRRHKETSRCCDTPLISVHMIGICQRLGGKLWALCEICGGLTQWEGAKFNNLGFTCGRHNHNKTKNNNNNNKKNLCYYCEIEIGKKNIKILDDDNCKFKYETVLLCEHDFEKCKFMFKNDSNTIVTKSALFVMLSKIKFKEGIKPHNKKTMKVLPI